MSSTPTASRQPSREGEGEVDSDTSGSNLWVVDRVGCNGLIQLFDVRRWGSTKLFDARRVSWHSGPKYLCMQCNFNGYGIFFACAQACQEKRIRNGYLFHKGIAQYISRR